MAAGAALGVAERLHVPAAFGMRLHPKFANDIVRSTSEIVLALADFREDFLVGLGFHQEVAADGGIGGAQEGIGFLLQCQRRRNREPVLGPQRFDFGRTPTRR